jgi:hypothetical protein
MATDSHKRSGGDDVRHYVKTCVPLMAPVSFLGAYRIHYGHGHGIGYAWAVRLLIDETCETVEQLHQSQSRIMEITRNVPAPWEVESSYYPADSTVPMFWVRVSKSESSNGHQEVRCTYGPNSPDPVDTKIVSNSSSSQSELRKAAFGNYPRSSVWVWETRNNRCG